MGKIYGYARVSTVQQDLRLQLEALEAFGIPEEDIFADKLTGKTMNRESLKELLSIVQPGDMIIVKKLDRLGRSVRQVISLLDDLSEKKIYVKSLDEGIDTSNDSPIARATIQLLAVFSEMERNFIVERTQAGIQDARKRGVKFGRKKSSDQIYAMAIVDYEIHGYSLGKVVEKYGKDANGKDLITPATFYRRLKEFREREGLQK
ncbi:recombinase family protein [Bacillus licheniformis]|uniref:recombinase family protein n=1 Tax=Bacillus licheniformis TaxID=1402 RepID=UPI0011AA7B36|nr:recombinase family protein [Bacillus licheniformis]